MSAERGGPDYTELEFPGPPGGRPYVLVNMIASADGVTAAGGTERGLGSRTDRRLLRALRVHADIVLTGAGTLRANGASPRLGDAALEELRARRGKPRLPLGAVLSRTGDLPLGDRFFTGRDFGGVVYLSDGAPAARAEAIEAAGRPVRRVPAGGEAPAMLRDMRERLGCRLLLLEGGPTLNGECFRLGLVDEFFLTVGALVLGGDRAPTAAETPGRAASLAAARRLALVSAHPNPATGELYLRYRVTRGAA